MQSRIKGHKAIKRKNN